MPPAWSIRSAPAPTASRWSSSGRYHLKVEPPAPFTAPSDGRARGSRAALTRPRRIAVHDRHRVLRRPVLGRFDRGARDSISRSMLQADRSRCRSACRATKRNPGDALLYRLSLRNLDATVSTDPVTITDRFSASLRLAPNSVRVDGETFDRPVQTDPDGHGLDPDAPGAGAWPAARDHLRAHGRGRRRSRPGAQRCASRVRATTIRSRPASACSSAATG